MYNKLVLKPLKAMWIRSYKLCGELTPCNIPLLCSISESQIEVKLYFQLDSMFF